MTNNTEWLQRVAVKLNDLHLDGIEFREVYRWVFDWDETLTIKENFRNAASEERALTTLSQAGAIHTHTKENYYRDQQEEQLATKGWGMWGDWDVADPGLRLYDYICYVDNFNYDKFMLFCDTHGLRPKTAPGQPKATEEPGGKNKQQPVQVPSKITVHPLELRHYSTRRGILTISPTVDVLIATKGKTKRPDGEKYLQCLVMERLFKSVYNLKSGVKFSTILSVNDSKIDKKTERKISNTVAEINKKVAAVGGPDKLIIIQNKKVFINNSYL